MENLFTTPQQKAILERDYHRCVACGNGIAEGFELFVVPIIPEVGNSKGIINGQTLCATHNFRKKNYKQTETGKKMFIRLYEAAKAISDTETMDFCSKILEVFEQTGVNGHIEWKR